MAVDHSMWKCWPALTLTLGVVGSTRCRHGLTVDARVARLRGLLIQLCACVSSVATRVQRTSLIPPDRPPGDAAEVSASAVVATPPSMASGSHALGVE